MARFVYRAGFLSSAIMLYVGGIALARGNKGVEKDRFRLGFKRSLNWMIEDIRFRVEALCAYIVLLLEVTIPLLLKQSRLGGIPSHGPDEEL